MQVLIRLKSSQSVYWQSVSPLASEQAIIVLSSIWVWASYSEREHSAIVFS